MAAAKGGGGTAAHCKHNLLLLLLLLLPTIFFVALREIKGIFALPDTSDLFPYLFLLSPQFRYGKAGPFNAETFSCDNLDIHSFFFRKKGPTFGFPTPDGI